jgi:hypothetical protein
MRARRPLAATLVKGSIALIKEHASGQKRKTSKELKMLRRLPKRMIRGRVGKRQPFAAGVLKRQKSATRAAPNY